MGTSSELKSLTRTSASPGSAPEDDASSKEELLAIQVSLSLFSLRNALFCALHKKMPHRDGTGGFEFSSLQAVVCAIGITFSSVPAF
mmetsp:Transcript_89256/g.198371  ORF Transcript_89256/g.198371 Transcript_89256/m.198371 type:complete len:87 (+) Transcript_89256:199-459(+)